MQSTAIQRDATHHGATNRDSREHWQRTGIFAITRVFFGRCVNASYGYRGLPRRRLVLELGYECGYALTYFVAASYLIYRRSLKDCHGGS